jgi:hypothetical protein
VWRIADLCRKSVIRHTQHREGGGDQECIVFYSVRGKTDVLFELLDDNRSVVGTLATRDFMEALEEQKKAA